MGLGHRVFIVNDDDSLLKISLAKYERLYQEDSQERLLQYAGLRVRCALVVLFFEERKPQSITWIDCHRIPFNAEGRVDLKEWENQGRHFVNSLALPFKEPKRYKIIDAHGVFAQKRYEWESKWSLTPELKQAIEEAIFGSNPGFPRIG